jgi:hypothetical protein
LYGDDNFEPLGRLSDGMRIDSAQMHTINRLNARYSEAHDSIYTELSRYLAAHASAPAHARFESTAAVQL